MKLFPWDYNVVQNDNLSRTFTPISITGIKLFTRECQLPLHKKMKFSIRDFFIKCDQICRKLLWSHLLKKSLMENFIFCAVYVDLRALCKLVCTMIDSTRFFRALSSFNPLVPGVPLAAVPFSTWIIPIQTTGKIFPKNVKQKPLFSIRWL